MTNLIFSTWKTIKIETTENLQEVVKKKDLETEVELVVVSVSQLGFKDRSVRNDIYTRARELGLDLCSAEVRLKLHDIEDIGYPKGEWLVIATEPLDFSSLLNLEYGRGEHWIGARFEYPDYTWNCHDLFIFCRC